MFKAARPSTAPEWDSRDMESARSSSYGPGSWMPDTGRSSIMPDTGRSSISQGSNRNLALALRDQRVPHEPDLRYSPINPSASRSAAAQTDDGIWIALLDANLIGSRTCTFYRNFSFSWPGAAWGTATTLIFAYMVAAPDPALVKSFGKPTIVFLANMAFFVTLCGNVAMYGSKWVLQSKMLASAIDQCRETLDRDSQTGTTFNANKWDCEVPLHKCKFFLKFITHTVLAAAVVGIVHWICPEVGKIFFLATLFTLGFFFLYLQGYVYVVDLLLILCVHSVTHLLMLIESNPMRSNGANSGTQYKFWRDVIEKHKAMSAMFEAIWEPAIWVLGPHVTAMVAFATIGLAGSLQGAKRDEPVAAALGFATLLAAVVWLKRLFERMACITEMCISSSLKQRSVFSLVMSRCGDCDWTLDQLRYAGYADDNEERADHDRCLHYLRLSKTGARMLGVLVDSSTVFRFVITSILGFAALLFYIAGSMDFGILGESSPFTGLFA